MDIQGSTVLVTGSNRGIGRAVVDAFVEAGAARVYAAMRHPVDSGSDRIVSVRLDVIDSAQIRDAAAKCGDVNILVNNAGILSGQALLSATDPAAAEREIRVNYLGTLEMCRAFAPALKRNGGGAIVNVLSILGRVSAPRVGSYSASKAASVSLTQGIRAELAPHGTLVVGVMPAFVDTDMAAGVKAPKLSPRDVAVSILTALRDGSEDVYPGQAADIAAAIQRDQKAVERQFAAMFRPA